ncbi:hypothetical protein YPPY25_0745, partial [Yersinia pestis PY-25]
MLWPFI